MTSILPPPQGRDEMNKKKGRGRQCKKWSIKERKRDLEIKQGKIKARGKLNAKWGKIRQKDA
jgi:hypothetical protein